MKEFCKWLGVSDKIARLILWVFFILVLLIVVNIALESLGLPFYKITVDNIKNINVDKTVEFLFACITNVFNFFTIILLIFRVKVFKGMIPYALLYLIGQIVFKNLFGYAAGQAFIVMYLLSFCYFYSRKNFKYVIYGIISMGINICIQYICFLYKGRFVDFAELNYATRTLLGLDFFIIMAVIILVKEVIVKKRSEKLNAR